MASPWRFLVVFLIIVPAIGCGSGRTVPVEGIVTLDGKPVPGATITFMPVDAEKGRVAHGRSDADGSFRLTTFRTDDGALRGEYKVVVKLDSVDKSIEKFAGKDPMQMSEGEKRKFFMQPSFRKESRGSTSSSSSGGVPEIYGDSEKTPLKEVVPPPGKIELKLRSTVR